jgi:hypothetical protein
VRPGGIAWAKVREFAEAGCDEEDITEALRISTETLNHPETRARFLDVVRRGNALARRQLQAAIAKRGTRTVKGAGSVNALALRARNLLKWDSGLEEQESAPDLADAKARLRLTLEKLAAVKTAEFGRPITATHILLAEVCGIELERLRGVEVEKILSLASGTYGPEPEDSSEPSYGLKTGPQ